MKRSKKEQEQPPKLLKLSMEEQPKLRNPNVRELKEQRVVYLTGALEQISELIQGFHHKRLPLLAERRHLVEQLGYDPTHGKVPNREVVA